MKNLLKKKWIRVILYITGMCAGLGITASLFGIIFMSFGSAKDIIQKGHENIASNYASMIVNAYESEDLETANKEISDTNFQYAIIKNINENTVSNISSRENWIATNIPEETDVTFMYQFNIFEGSYRNYNISSLFGALKRDLYSHYGTISCENEITYYIFDKDTGIFYVSAGSYYFPVKFIFVNHGDLSYDYKLQEIDGKMCYYNNYYNMLLDTTQYQTWEWIKLGENGSYGSQMTLYDNQSYSDIKFAQNATFIQDNLYQSSDYNITKWGTVNYTDTNIPKEYSIVARINPQQPYEDFFVEWERLVNDIHYYQDDSVFVLFQFIVLFLLCVFCLIYGTTNEKEELTFLRKAPLLMYSVIFISIEVLLGAGIVGFVGIVFHEQVTFSVSNFIGIIAEIVLVILAFLLFYITNITARIKTKTLYRNSEVYYLIKPIGYCGKRITEIFRELRANTPIFWKFVIAEVILTCIQLFITMNLYRYNIDMLILFVLLYKILEVLGVMFVIYQMIELQKGAKRVACGDLLKPIDTTRMFWEFKKHGEYINQTGEGISLAVEKQLKSERFKTELITNVSHDIKTPLTSIINYVDLIKKQHITDETLCEYIEVLDRQSARLKKLIEDLMEASKASTGNLTVHLEECNADVLLSQVIGEFEEKFIQKGLQIVLNKPETQVVLQADGRHLWRVFDNLMGNIYKYAQSNTRVYINLEKTERGVKFIFKNISQSQLNISSDELLERFVRGDSSRNTEGSGLGLSIAQSLTELMQGTMHLDIDGDLFKVTLQFPIEYKKQESVDDIFEKEPQDDIFEKVEKKSDKKLEKIKKFLRKKS